MKKFVLLFVIIVLSVLLWFTITTMESLNKKNIDFLSAVPSNAQTIIGSYNAQSTLLKLQETSNVWQKIKEEESIAKIVNDVNLLLKANTTEEQIQLAVVISANGNQSNTLYLFSGVAYDKSTNEKEFSGKSYKELFLENQKFYVFNFKEFVYVSRELAPIQDVITSIATNSFLTAKDFAKTSLSKSETKDFFVLTKGVLTAESSDNKWMFYDGEVFINSITLLGAYSKKMSIEESLTLSKLLPKHYSFNVKPASDSLAFASEWATVADTKGNKALIFKLKKSLRYTMLSDFMVIDSVSPQRFTISGKELTQIVKDKFLVSDTLYGIEEVDFAVLSNNKDVASNLSFEIKNARVDNVDVVAESFNINTQQSSSKIPILGLFKHLALAVEYNAYTTLTNDFVIDRIDISNTTKVTQTKAEYLWEKSIGSIKQGPFLIKNHRTNNQEILIVDTDHKLHLIGVNGEVKWSKQLSGDIIGGVSQVDILNNKRYQLLFNTASKLYLIDILGKDLAGFPLSSKEKITNEVAAIDYENNKNYRFIFATENQLVAYDKFGKRVDGFKHFLKGELIQSKVYHFILSGNDYVVTNSASGKLLFLNRKAEVRHNSNAQSKIPNVFATLSTQQNLNNSTIYHIDTLGRIVELSLAPTSVSKIKDANVSNKLIMSDVSQSKRYMLSLKDRQVNIYNKTASLLSEITCDFTPINAQLFSDNLQTGKLAVLSSNNELYIYDFKQQKFEKAYNNVSYISTIEDIDRNGKPNIVVVQNSKLVCYEL